jgi:plasmid stability protein
MADIVITDIEEQALRRIEVRAICNGRTLEEELIAHIVDGLSEIHDPATVRAAFCCATIELDDYRTLDESVSGDD